MGLTPDVLSDESRRRDGRWDGVADAREGAEAFLAGSTPQAGKARSGRGSLNGLAVGALCAP
jgi:hypothetical protein